MIFGRPIKIDWEKIHTCEKSKGKIIMIGTDGTGRTFCGYCGAHVNYDQEIKEETASLQIERLRCPTCNSDMLCTDDEIHWLCDQGHNFIVPKVTKISED